VDYQKLLLQHLDLVDRVVRHIARRHHLSSPDADEFRSHVRFKLIDKDFAILRKFQGRSNLATYLTTVVERLYLDFCTARWGKWRPSSAALRLGHEAVLLEELIGRRGLSFTEAVGTLQTDRAVALSREQLHAIMVQLPGRTVRRDAGEQQLAIALSRRAAPDGALDRMSDRQIVARVEAALAAAVTTIAVEDQLILKLRFEDGLSVAAIGRLLREDSKVLYRRLESITAKLRQSLHEDGIDRSDVDRVVGHPDLILGRLVFGEPAP
jgi:RNA polymerase sigma factor (sigma-70 family)